MTITVDEYINSFYQQIQINLIKLRKIIKETALKLKKKYHGVYQHIFKTVF